MLEKSIFIFHRSLRLIDNIGFINASLSSKVVIPIFIFTPEQISDKNQYKSNNAINFMIESLINIQNKITSKNGNLYIYYGKQHEILESIFKKNKDIDGVFLNKDYTKYAIEREKKIEKVCVKFNRFLGVFNDYLLHDVNTTLNGLGTNYSKFTPYYKKVIEKEVELPNNFKIKNYGLISNNIKTVTIEYIKKHYLNYNDINTELIGGRISGIKAIKKIKNFKLYDETRDDMTKYTTQLSAHIKFGTISIREIYHYIKKLFGVKHSIIRQLYWREFYFNIAYNNPDIFSGYSFKEKYDKIIWEKNVKKINKWKNGNTGFPIVDAAMRELNNSGYMHNRGRLITANFLVKILNIDWREGEKYFAKKLTDYDPSINNGNWQWVSGSGADSQQYNRIYNPCSQSGRHDPDAIYIKKWIPELSNVNPSYIHKWPMCYSFYPKIKYVKPMIDYKIAREKSLKMYKKYLYS